MSAAPDYSPGWAAEPPAGLGELLAGAEASVGRLAADADLSAIAGHEAAAVMGTLTTLIAQLDWLRVGVAQVVGERELCNQRGTRNLTGWLRADPRVADDAWKLARLAASAPRLPKITGLLEAGEVSLAQAAAASWQVAQLPEVPRRPDAVDLPEGSAVSGSAEGDRWVGLWRAGDVHAAADELFAGVLPRLDCGQVRQLGAHLREAADAQQCAAEDYGDFARRGLRISRSLGGCGEITGRLHAEAAERVIAAFEELGARAGPDDPRTKAQRWADALTRLAGTADMAPATVAPASAAPARAPVPDSEPGDGQPCPSSTGHDDHSNGHISLSAGGHTGAGLGVVRHDDAGPAAAEGSTDGAAAEGHGPIPAGFQRPRLLVTVPLATLLREPLAPGATILGSGTVLTAEAARRLGCDAEVIRLITDYPAAGTTAPSGDAAPPGTIAPSGDAGPPGTTGPPQDTGPPGITGPPGDTGPPGVPRQPGTTGPPGDAGRPDDRQPGAGPQAATGTATERLRARLATGIAQLPPPLATPSALVDIGRKSSGWTPRQRDALSAQHGGRCGHPGCGSRIDVIHHIVHWADGGPTSISNGIPLCLYHHWLVHEGGWRLTKHSGGTATAIPPPPGWRPGTVYRHGIPVREHPSPGIRPGAPPPRTQPATPPPDTCLASPPPDTS